jgi:hypothetical protein
MTGTASRPILITIGAIVTALNGIAYLIYAAEAFGVIDVFGVPEDTTAGIVLVAIAALTIIVSWGLFTLQGWAWILAVVSFTLSLIGDAFLLFQIVTGDADIASATGIGTIIGTLIHAGLLYYLFTPTVRAAFGRV